MAFTDVFGGELIFPSQLSYLSITTAVDIELQWPTEQQITGDNVVADFLDINATVGGLTVDMPDARNTSTGNKTTFNGISLNGFTVRDNTGGVIQFVGDGEQWVIVLTDNSTQAGLWSAFQLGAATTIASASALAGAGLQANIGGMLEQIIDSDEEIATFSVVDGDRAKCLIYTGGAGTANLPSAGTVFSNWFFMLRNSGSGTLAVTPPSGNIDGSSSLSLDPNSSAFIFTDGTDYFTIGLTASSTIAFDFVSIPIPGSGDFVLSGANLNRIAYRFTGALTGNRKVVVPDTTQQYWCDNQTTGAFVLSIGTAAQASPPTLDAGTTAIFYSNSTEVIDAVNAVSVSFPILISQGGTGQSTAPLAVAALRALPTIEDLTSVAPAGGDFIAFQDIDDANNNKRATIDDILAGAAGVEQLIDSGGNIRVRAETLGIAQLRSVADTDAEDRLLNFTHQDGTLRGQLGYVGDANLVLRNSIPTGDFILETQKFGGGALDLLKFDSSGGDVTFLSENVMRAAFDNGDTIWRGQVNSFLTLHFDNIEVARTALTASGGLFVTNLATGAGSERVLTTADNDALQTNIDDIISARTFIEGGQLDENDAWLVFDSSAGVNKKVSNQSVGMRVQLAQGSQSLVNADLNTIMEFNGTATLTINTNATTPLPIGSKVILVMDNATQQLSVTAAGGVTLNSVFHPGGGVAATDHLVAGGTAELRKTATNDWYLTGDIVT